MSLLKLPNEIILDIVDYLDEQWHIYATTCVNRRLYRLLRDELLRHSIHFRGGDALIWAARKGRSDTVHATLRLGADINATRTRPRGITPLYAAAKTGSVSMVETLLNMGADPEAGGVRNRKPLYTALVSRNEEVARILFDETSNMDISIAEPEQDQTALHVACYCRLLESIQYFLERGANVNRITSQASTPLDLILRSSNSNPGYSLSENDFKIVLLLLEFGTKLSEKTCMYGLKHPDRRVRGLFQTSGTVKDTGKRVLIGRSWMASSAEFDPNELYGSSGINRGRSQPASQDTQQSVDETFPALNHSSQPNEPAQRHEWTPSKVQRIIADFSNAKRPLRVGPLPRDPFPKLGPLEISTRTSAGDLWRTFRGQ